MKVQVYQKVLKLIEMKIQHNVRNIVSSTGMEYDAVTANPIWRTVDRKKHNHVQTQFT